MGDILPILSIVSFLLAAIAGRKGIIWALIGRRADLAGFYGAVAIFFFGIGIDLSIVALVVTLK